MAGGFAIATTTSKVLDMHNFAELYIGSAGPCPSVRASTGALDDITFAQL